MKRTTNKFALLENYNIIKILCGAESFGPLEIEGEQGRIIVSMPTLTLEDVSNIATRCGYSFSYLWADASPDEEELLKILIEYCVEHEKEQQLLSLLFAKGQFIDKLKDESRDIIEFAYYKIVEIIIQKINEILYFSSAKLVERNNRFWIVEQQPTAIVDAPTIESCTHSEIASSSSQIIQAMRTCRYKDAITQARTLLEKALVYAIKHKNGQNIAKGKLQKLYNQVKSLYVVPNTKIGELTTKLLLGLEPAILAIGELRDKHGNAHAIVEPLQGIEPYHIRLFTNSAISIAEFILSMVEHDSEY